MRAQRECRHSFPTTGSDVCRTKPGGLLEVTAERITRVPSFQSGAEQGSGGLAQAADPKAMKAPELWMAALLHSLSQNCLGLVSRSWAHSAPGR